MSLKSLTMLAATSRCNRHDCTYKCEEKKKKISNREQHPRICNANRCCTMQSRRSSREKYAHRKVGIKPRQNAATRADHCSTQGQTPRSSMLRQKNTQAPIPEENPQIQRVRKFAGSRVPASSLASHQSFNTFSKVPMWVQNTLRDLVCCGSALACPCCRHGRWSCARSSCPRYCVGWAKIACQH